MTNLLFLIILPLISSYCVTPLTNTPPSNLNAPSLSFFSSFVLCLWICFSSFSITLSSDVYISSVLSSALIMIPSKGIVTSTMWRYPSVDNVTCASTSGLKYLSIFLIFLSTCFLKESPIFMFFPLKMIFMLKTPSAYRC